MWIADKAKGIGQGIGKAITFGVTSLFGLDTGGIVEDGVSIGAAFGEGFAEGFDGEKVAEALKNAVESAVKLIFSNPVTGGLAVSWIGSNILGSISSVYSMGKSAKGLWRALFGSGMTVKGGTKGTPGLFSGIAQGLKIRKAAEIAEKMRVAESASMGSVVGRIGNSPAESALVLAQNGKMGLGAKIGASGIGGMAVKAGAAAGAVKAGTTLISAGGDFYDAVEALKSDNEKEAMVYGISGAEKILGVASGAAAGAAIGSVVPVVGTAAGALIGAGIGAFAGEDMADDVKQEYEEELERERERQAAEILRQNQAKYASENLKKALADPNMSEDKFNQMFQDEVLKRLEARFGDISLSMSEIQSIAKKITFGNAADSLNSFVEASEEAKSSLSDLQSSAMNLKKINWKANLSGGMGIELSKDDYAEFVAETENIISKSKDFLEDKHFETTAAIKFLYNVEGEIDENSDIGKDIQGVDSIFNDLQKQIDEKANEIKIILNKEGMLAIDKEKAINELLGEITEITNAVSEAEAEAQFDYLHFKYGGKGADRESFAQLQEELKNQREIAEENARESYIADVAQIRLQEKYGDLSEDEAKKEIEEAEEQLNSSLADFGKRGIELTMNTLGEIYGDSAIADKILPNFEGDLEERLQTAISAKLAINPNAFKKWTDDQWAEFLGLTGMNEFAGEFAALLTPLIDNMSEGYLKKFKEETPDMVDLAYRLLGDELKEKEKEIIELNPTIRFNPNVVISEAGEDKPNIDVVVRSRASIKPLPEWAFPHAEGGILTQPHIGLVAEDGAEAVIPLSGKRRSRGISLWEKAGELLGIRPKGGVLGSIQAHAKGGIMTEPHIGLVGEAGPEAIIPLSGSNREHGARLWEQTGEILGLIPKHANGGIFGSIINKSDESGDSENNMSLSAPVTVNLGGITITINASGGDDGRDIMEIIRRNIPEISNDVAGEIAKALLKLFPNLKAGII